VSYSHQKAAPAKEAEKTVCGKAISPQPIRSGASIHAAMACGKTPPVLFNQATPPTHERRNRLWTGLMIFDLSSSRNEIGRCAAKLRAALANWKSPDAFAADMHLAANAAIELCDCEPAAWGDAPAAIARLLLPHRFPEETPSAQAALASHWALHLFALLNASPTIRRALIEVAPAFASGKQLERLRKRVNEISTLTDSIKRHAELSPHARITFQLIALNTGLMGAALSREEVDLRLIEHAANDVAARSAEIPGREAPKLFQDLAERANAAIWETNRLIQAQSRQARGAA
jgi:hypothetical protein